MNLIVVNIDSIRIGHPLPFSLRDETGILLASKGFVVEKRDDLLEIIGRRSQLFVDVAESQDHLRAYQGKLLRMVRRTKHWVTLQRPVFRPLTLTAPKTK